MLDKTAFLIHRRGLLLGDDFIFRRCAGSRAGGRSAGSGALDENAADD
jgi:hypothetical protein